MHRDIITAAAGDRLLLLGNEAIVRGALEAGVSVATTYPGTPASEIGDTFHRIAPLLGIRFEYSINEKVAFEVAYGACLGGVRAITSMKHLGLNVAGDPFVTSAYVGVRGGLVVVSAGEPGCHTSPNEQDHRYFARMAYVPVFDPSDPQEALEMARAAFELSERWNVPVLVRPTTRVSHTQGIVATGAIVPRVHKGELVPDASRFVPVPRNARAMRVGLIERMAQAARDPACRAFNRLEGKGSALAVVTSGVSYAYVLDALDSLGARGDARVLKLGIPWPVQESFVRESLEGAAKILVVEEGEPFIEDFVKKSLQEAGASTPVLGKGTGAVPLPGELSPALVRRAIEESLRPAGTARRAQESAPPAQPAAPPPPLPVRPPILCPGCPHRASFFALRLVAGKDDIFVNDIGCYTLGMDPPFNMGDTLLSMGSSITEAGGFSMATKRKTVAFIGDSTFFHSGVPGLENAVVNGHDLLAVVLDNGATAMTGHQPSPSDLRDPDSERAAVPSLSVEALCRACGVQNLVVVDPFDERATHRAIKDFYKLGGVSVVVSRHPCPLSPDARAARERKVYRVEKELCRSCCVSAGGGSCACGLPVSAESSRVRVLKRLAGCESIRTALKEAPCTASCPAGVCIQGFIAFALAGKNPEAYRVIRRSLPLPGVLARVCPRPCEKACVRTGIDEPVAVNDVKRRVVDAAAKEERAALAAALLKDTVFHGRKAAVVGSGPAGLACAWELRARGYEVTVFEKDGQPGGLLRRGIPRFRLPADVLDRDVEEILASGVVLKTGAALGRDFGMDDLFRDGFAAVFVATGLSRGTMPPLPGGERGRVVHALDFLAEAAGAAPPSARGDVVVIGGGDAAIDSARSALRLGASSATVLYRRAEEEMPASRAEVAEAREEGVRFVFHAAPLRLDTAEEGAPRLVAVRTRAGETDASGRRSPVEVPGSAFELKANLVAFATGQAAGKEVGEAFGAGGLSPGGLVAVEPATMETARRGVFAGGDVVTGPLTVVGAIAAGRRGAWGIDVALRGAKAPPLDPPLPPEGAAAAAAESLRVEGAAKKGRVQPPSLGARERTGGFEETALGYDGAQMAEEAGRCLACATCGVCSACTTSLGCPAFYADRDGKIAIDEGLCNGCGLCVDVCPNGAIRAAQTPAPARVEASTRREKRVRLYVSRTAKEAAPPAGGALRLHLAGVGGQGTLSASGVIGEAARRAGLRVLVSALHGMAQRGGMVTNQIIVGDALSPVIDPGEADVVAGFEPLETVRSLPFGREGCVVVMSSAPVIPFPLTIAGRPYPSLEGLVDETLRKAARLYVLDATAVAAASGSAKAVGAVFLGFLAGAGLLPFPPGLLREALEEGSSGERLATNLRAFEEGMRVAAESS